ncbi:HNH endonuclease [Citrobacter sp. BDA59-3]|uniref:HNH endonuclease n=1 Tax=Citrobacter sp. BDA59-3 TaxID=2781952 RepID=UPI00187FCC5E|nr:HNH endonuclease [Citrobacter sp. BDA59-3]QOV67772.1 HNH endonuclease [Citrobacter sp. BDA59-3]
MEHTFDDVYKLCVSGKSQKKLTSNDVFINSYLRACHRIFYIYASYGIYYLYKDVSESNGFNKKALISLYQDKLVGKKRAGRYYYELLLSRTYEDKCQICFHGEAETLDHYLPKDLYPSLSISHYNLYPACHICNGKKGDWFPSTPEQQLIHPQFDDIYKGDWLLAKFDKYNHRVVFMINTIRFHENTCEYKRLKLHLEKHGIIQIYEGLAMRKIQDIVRTAICYSLPLQQVVSSELQILFDNFNKQKESNSLYTFEHWKYVTCRALSQSEFFLKNGKDIFGTQHAYHAPSHRFRG